MSNVKLRPRTAADPDGLKLITHGDKRTEAALDAIDQALQKNLDKAKNPTQRRIAKNMLQEFRKIRNNTQKPIPINPSSKPNQWNPVNPFDNNQDETIDWNPDCETGGKADKDGRRPPYVGLAHEISHAMDYVFSRGAYASPNNPKYAPNRGEERALDFENAVRNGAGLPRRESYWDNIIK